MASTARTSEQFTAKSLENSKDKTLRFPPINIRDNGKLCIGGQGPCFRPNAIADTDKVRLGGQGPIFR